MSRFNVVLFLVLGIVIGALATSLVNRGAHPGLGPEAVQAIVDKALARHDAARPAASPDAENLGPAIEKYLMSDPEVLARVAVALDQKRKAEAVKKTAALVSANSKAIFDAPGEVVVGNPKGDVTLVEMFDYNCSFCRGALPDLVGLVAADKNLRLVLRQFPILGPDSVAAAKVAVAVGRTDADYWAFHQALYQSRGTVTAETALAEAKALGLDPERLKAEAAKPDVTNVIQSSYDLANTLGIGGTPTYIIGDEVIPGAVPIDELKSRIANMRRCGKTQCESQPG